MRREVYRDDVERMVDWLRDERVTEHLNEDQNIDRSLRRAVRLSSLPVFSAQFNRHGTFFLLTVPGRGPIGFMRLVPKDGEKAEIVVVIGEPEEWGKGYGTQAIRRGAEHVFDEWGKEELLATIHKENDRSRRVFRKLGFSRKRDLDAEVVLALEPGDL